MGGRGVSDNADRQQNQQRRGRPSTANINDSVSRVTERRRFLTIAQGAALQNIRSTSTIRRSNFSVSASVGDRQYRRLMNELRTHGYIAESIVPFSHCSLDDNNTSSSSRTTHHQQQRQENNEIANHSGSSSSSDNNDEEATAAATVAHTPGAALTINSCFSSSSTRR
jgi:hypothetical protein